MAEKEGRETQLPKQADELPEAQGSPPPGTKGEQLMSSSVSFSNQDMKLVLYEKGLAIEELNGPKKEKTAKTKGLDCQWCDVISAQKFSDNEAQKQTLRLHFMEKQKNRSLRTKSVIVTVTGDNFDNILSAIQDQCWRVSNRPKKLFVLINPIGGNCKGVQIYEKKIAPIFALASCETTVMTSERAKHALEIGETQDFTGYDGIICVSGDGLYQELLEGYLKQLQKAHGVDIHDPRAKLVKPSIPFCLMPAGSSNGTVRYTNDGVIDIETSALRVLRGEIHPLNIVTVHAPGQLVGVCGLAFGIGLISDLLKHSDERRWMKKARYAYSIAAVLLKRRRMYDAQVEYILDEGDGAGSAEDGTEHPRKEWTVFNPEGKRYACNAFLVSRMVNVGTKTIVDPYSDSGVLVLDTGCTNWGFFKYARTMMAQQAAADIPNLHIKDKAVGLRVKILREVAATDSGACSGATTKTTGETEAEAKGETEESESGETTKPGERKSREQETKESEVGGGDKPNEEGKTEAAKQRGGERRNKRAEGLARAVARDSELEHYVYLDGEIRRVDGLEFECRLHSSFVPMFGCVASELVDTKSAHNSELGDSSENK